jgi:hypothetical protein
MAKNPKPPAPPDPDYMKNWMAAHPGYQRDRRAAMRAERMATDPAYRLRVETLAARKAKAAAARDPDPEASWIPDDWRTARRPKHLRKMRDPAAAARKLATETAKNVAESQAHQLRMAGWKQLLIDAGLFGETE